MSKKQGRKIRNKKIAIAIMEYIITLGCLLIAFVMVNGNKIHQEDSYAKPEAVSKYEIKDEYITRVRPLTEYESFKEIAENSLNRTIRVYKNETRTEEVLTGNIKSGMIIDAIQEGTVTNTEIVNSYKVSVVGDLNNDGDCNVLELTKIIRNIIGLEELEDRGKELSADFNGDDQINVVDVTMCINYIVYGEIEPDKDPTAAPQILVTGDGNDEWYKGDVNVKIIENGDKIDRTVSKIEFKLKDEDRTRIQSTKSREIVLSDEGTYKITSQSYGTNGTKSEEAVKIINIDKTQPIINIQREDINVLQCKLIINVNDDNLIKKYSLKRDGKEEAEELSQKEFNKEVTINENGSYRVIVEDFAGNTTTQEFVISDLKKKCTVVFKDEDDNEISREEYIEGERIVIPEAPEKEEDEDFTYEFKGWEPEIQEIAREDIEYTPVYESISKEFTVTFYNEDKTEVIDIVTFKANATGIDEPVPPEREGYVGLWTEYELKNENTESQLYYVEKIENGTQLEATDKNGITWNYTYQDGKATNVYYRSGSLGKNVVIPFKLDNYPVESIGNPSWNNMFTNQYGESYYYYEIEKIDVPYGVKEIKERTFAYCQNALEIILPDSIEKIQRYAFENSGVLNINMGKNIENIDSMAFQNAYNLYSINVSEENDNYSSESGILFNKDKTILYKAPVGRKITNYTIPEDVTTIGRYAFERNTQLESIALNERIERIEEYAFSGCYNLKEIRIPNSIEYIDVNAFQNCDRLSDIYIDDDRENVQIPEDYRYKAFIHYRDCKHSFNFEIYKENLRVEEITNSIENNEVNCGENCSFKVLNENNEVVSDEVVIVIAQGLYTNSENKTGTIKPNEDGIYTVRNIDRDITITIGRITDGLRLSCEDENGLTWNYTYQDGNAVNVYLEKGTIGKKVKVPSELEGHRVLSIENIERDDNVFDKINYDSNYERTLNTNSYDPRDIIEEIELPEGLLTIGRNAFDNFRNLKKINIPDSLINIGDYAFNYCYNINYIELPDSITNIGESAFNGCNSLIEINIPERITEIKPYTFQNCYNLKTVIIPEGVTILKNGCFYYCYNLEEVTLPESLISIQRDAFRYCYNLKSITIPKNVETIGDGDAPFYDCSRLEEIKVDSENNYFCDVNGILYNKEKTTLIMCPRGITTEINIPDTVTTIGKYAFYNNYMEHIDLPSSVTTIRDYAFYNCNNLKEIQLPENITSIEYYTFSQCRGLKEIRIPESVTRINDYAFSYCYEMTDMYIDNLKENVSYQSRNNNAYLHYKDCRHNIELKSEGVHLEEVESNLVESTIQCGETFKFKVVDNETNEVIKDRLAIIKSQGKFTNSGNITYAIYADEDGIYTIENIKRNIEITIEDIRNGLKVNAIDGNGITWSFKYEDGKAIEVHYVSGELGEIVEIPSELNSYPVENLYNSTLNGNGGIFATEEWKSNTQISQIIIPESVHTIGRNAFYGCINIKKIEIPSSVTKIEYGILSNCIKITDIYIDNLEENVEIEGDLNGYGYVHFSNCRHDIAFEKYTNQYVNVETIGEDGQDEHIDCRHDYRFRLLDQNGTPVTTERVLVRYVGIETELDEEERDYFERARRMLENSSNMFVSEEEGIRELQPEADGTYKVEKVHRNITIIVGSYQTTDTNGITWNYSINDGKATNVYYESGNIGETVEIPSELEGHQVYSLYNKEETGSIFEKAEDTAVIKNVIIKNGLNKIDKYAFYKLDSIETIEIPESVTEIGYAAFYNCENLEELVVPGNVEKIGKFAFARCRKIKTLEMPESVTKVGIGAFSTCEELETINLSSNIEILPDYLFSNCEKLKSIEIPDSITVIGKRTFNYCCSLENIVIPDTVTLLGESALSGCLSLKTTQLSNNIEILDYGVFSNCQSLTQINIPTNIKEIRGSAFESCSNITNMEIPGSVKKIGIAFSGCSSLKNIYIDNYKEDLKLEEYDGNLWYPWYAPVVAQIHYKGCTHSVKIRKYMEDNTVLESVDADVDNESIPCRSDFRFKLIKDDNVIMNRRLKITELGTIKKYDVEKEIESDENGIYTIEDIKTNIEIPIGDKQRQATDENGIIWEYTYEDGKAINVHYVSGGLGTVLEIPSKLDGYPIVNLYYENSDGEAANILGSNRNEPIIIKISEGITSIDKRAFYDCYNLKEIQLPKSIKNIGEEAFYNCYYLKNITFPKKLKNIGKRAFMYCSRLETLELPNGLTEIGEEAFYNCNNSKNINLPNSINNIGRGAFRYCSNLENIELPSELKVIESGLFYGCSNLKNVLIKNKVEKIEYEAFSNCGNLEEVILPDSVNYIGRYAFAWCGRLSNIIIPDSVVIAEYNCIEGTPYYNNLPDGEIIYLGSAAYRFKGEMPENTIIQIRDGAQLIPARMFENCKNLIGIELPDSITEIGESAFKDCDNLRYVDMSKNTKCIGAGAFENCTSLSKIVIWRDVEVLRERTFEKWKKDQTINFEVEEVQEGWDVNWNKNCNAEIVFGYTGE